jgi:hypothetical protein
MTNETRSSDFLRDTYVLLKPKGFPTWIQSELSWTWPKRCDLLIVKIEIQMQRTSVTMEYSY